MGMSADMRMIKKEVMEEILSEYPKLKPILKKLGFLLPSGEFIYLSSEYAGEENVDNSLIIVIGLAYGKEFEDPEEEYNDEFSNYENSEELEKLHEKFWRNTESREQWGMDYDEIEELLKEQGE